MIQLSVTIVLIIAVLTTVLAKEDDKVFNQAVDQQLHAELIFKQKVLKYEADSVQINLRAGSYLKDQRLVNNSDGFVIFRLYLNKRRSRMPLPHWKSRWQEPVNLERSDYLYQQNGLNQFSK